MYNGTETSSPLIRTKLIKIVLKVCELVWNCLKQQGMIENSCWTVIKKKKKGKPCEAAKANRLTPVSKEKATKSVDLKEVNLVYNIRSHLFIKQEVFKWAI